jgi:BirA family biotin operon repressor/biotin-[acetyl-CoA-carboxylase] ligase
MKCPLQDGPWLELPEVDSTQRVAARRLRGEEIGPVPGVVLAAHQTEGRGRFERNWHTSPGDSLAMSLVFQAYAGHPKPWLIGMAVACAAAAAVHCRLQWPNDLVLAGMKAGGILSELIVDGTGRKVPVVGVGINLNMTAFPEELRDTAISLAMFRPGLYDARTIAEAIVDRVASLPEPDDWSALRPVWSLFDMTPGKRYQLSGGQTALGVGIGPEGELICSVDGETHTVHAADAIFGAR